MKTLILANGNGSRMYPLTAFINKNMIPIDGKPILEHIIQHLKKYEFTDIIMAVGVFKEQIMNYFQHGGRWGVNIEYSESTEPQGTAGELAKASEHFKGEQDFLIYYGDTLTNTHLSHFYDFHKTHQGTITIHGIREYTIDTGIIKYNGNCRPTTFEEKPHLPIITNIPIFWCSKKIFTASTNIAKDKDFNCDVIPELLNNKEIFVYIQDHNFHYDVGNIDRLQRISEAFENKMVGIIKVIK